MNNIFADWLSGYAQFIKNFDIKEFITSISGILTILILLLSGYLSIKTYKDADRRFNDNWVVAGISIFVFITNIFGYVIYSLFKPKEFLIDQHISNMEKYLLEYETRGIGKCKVCRQVYFPEHTYCINCGNVVRTKCSMCANIIELDWKVCPYCGDKKIISISKQGLALTDNSLKSIENIK